MATRKLKLQKRLFVVYDPADGVYSVFPNKGDAKMFAEDIDSINNNFGDEAETPKATIAAYTLEG